MTVRELKDVLAWYDDDKEVFIAENNNFGASYAYSLSDDNPVLVNHGIRSNWGRDVFENECLILLFDEQVGAVWESEELEEVNIKESAGEEEED